MNYRHVFEKLDQRRTSCASIETFKILSGMYDVSGELIFNYTSAIAEDTHESCLRRGLDLKSADIVLVIRVNIQFQKANCISNRTGNHAKVCI